MTPLENKIVPNFNYSIFKSISSKLFLLRTPKQKNLSFSYKKREVFTAVFGQVKVMDLNFDIQCRGGK